jgi:hypothetical protein
MNSGEIRRDPARRPRLALEIAALLCIKAVLLFGLWAAFFSHPAGRQLTEGRVAADLFGPGPASSMGNEAPHGPRP